jgi:hypothetical protein
LKFPNIKVNDILEIMCSLGIVFSYQEGNYDKSYKGGRKEQSGPPLNI